MIRRKYSPANTSQNRALSQKDYLKKNRQQLLRPFGNFHYFGSSQWRGGSWHSKAEWHKVSDCSKPMSDGCFPWQCREGHILRPYASVPFIAGRFCLPQQQWQALALTPLPFVQVSVQRGAWSFPPAVVTGMKYQQVNASYTLQTGKFMALLWSFHYSAGSLPDYSTSAWQLRSLERGTLMHLMYIYNQDAGCWQGQGKIMKCCN